MLCAYHRFQHSYAVLLSASPDLQNADPDDKFAAWFSRQLGKLMKKENLVKLLPDLINDASSFYQQLTSDPTANGGMFDPFQEMNRLIFQLTMRTVGATEIAESPVLFSQSFKLVRQIGENSSTARIIIPWLPTWRYMKRMIASMRLYMMINGFARERTATGRRENDALQLLLDDGESGTKVVEVNFAMLPLDTTIYKRHDRANKLISSIVDYPRRSRGPTQLWLERCLGVLLPCHGSSLDAESAKRGRQRGCQTSNQLSAATP